MTDFSSITDITDEPRAHTVDEILAQAENHDTEAYAAAMFNTPVPDEDDDDTPYSAQETVNSFYALTAAHLSFINGQIDSLVEQRRAINDDIRLLRDAKAKAERMVRIIDADA